MAYQDRPLKGKRIVVLVEDLYEDLELWYPLLRLREAGAETLVAGPGQPREFTSKHGYPVRSDLNVADVRSDDFDGVVIPGGYAPDRMRRCPELLAMVRQFAEAGRMVAFICHAGWVPASAGVLGGVNCTSFSAIKDDLINAGARWEDRPLVVDRNFVSSRSPDDLPEFCRGMVAVLGGSAEGPPTPAFATSQFSRTAR